MGRNGADVVVVCCVTGWWLCLIGEIFRLDFAGLKQLCRIDFSRKSNCTEMCFVLHLRSSWALFRKDLQSKRLWIIPVWRPHCVQCAEYQSVGHWCAMLSGRESSVLCVVESTLCCVAGHWAGSSGAVQADLPSWKLPASRQLLPTSPTCIPLSASTTVHSSVRYNYPQHICPRHNVLTVQYSGL